MQIDKNIFREYDIRGIAGEKFEPKIVEEYEKWYGPFPGTTINLVTCEAIGKAYGTRIKQLGGQKVIVGYEVRPFAEKLKDAFIKGITKTGIDVIDAGKTTTPLIYFLTSHLKFDGGVNITGSHNVYFFNGFKMVKKNSAPIYSEELYMLYKMIINDQYDLSESPGKIKKLDELFRIYKDYILNQIKIEKPFKIVLDCGNGSAGLFAEEFFKGLGCEILAGLYMEPDAYFPNHVPDPESPHNMQDLSKKVKKTKANFGIAFDADGDRVGFVNEKGEYIFADEVLLILAKDVLLRHPGKKILFDVKCSQLLVEMLPKFNGKPYMHKTGHAPIKDTMRKELDVMLGGEVSGHFFIAENYYRIDDGFMAAAKILQLLSKFDGLFSEMFSFIPRRVRTPEIKLPCADDIKFKIIEKITNEFSKKYQTITIDGARIMFDQTTWAIVRASNTSPYITVRFEAKTKEKLLEIKNIVADELEKYSEIKDKLNHQEVATYTGVLGYV